MQEFEILYGILNVLAVEFLKNCTACWKHLHFYGLSICPRDLDRNIDTAGGGREESAGRSRVIL